MAQQTNVTRILSAIDRGDAGAASALLPVVYDELRTLAATRLAREGVGQTLQATALVHEAYLRLLGPDGSELQWHSRGHFFAAAAEAMRRILIDAARAKRAEKRGGERRKIRLPLDALTLRDVPDEVLDLDEALVKLAQCDPAKAELVRLRFFAGLTLTEAAAAMNISATTADNYWAYARAWLYNEIYRETPPRSI
ncbi:MAG: sigma-70 family RNA polymerase sigma factor [Planctomycetia bacterium]|nr:MAG: sigma-70 family RNA polymerase sigma factor [Planctomycetia bacterium]